MLLSLEELDNLSGCIWRELCDHDELSDFVLATFLQVTTMTMATIVRRKPAIDAEMMMSRGMDSFSTKVILESDVPISFSTVHP